MSKAIVSMLCITALASIALLKGMDGLLLAGAVSALAGLGGFAVGRTTKK